MKRRRKSTLHDAFQTACRMIVLGDAMGFQQHLEEFPRLAKWQGREGLGDGTPTLLHELAKLTDAEQKERMARMASVLLAAGAHVDARENRKNGPTPLHRAIQYDNHTLVSILLKAGASLKRCGLAEEPYSTTLGYALYYEAKSPERWRAKNDTTLLLEWGATVQLPHLAALGKLEALESILRQDPGPVSLAYGLMFASHCRQLQSVNLLLQYGADTNTLIPFFGRTISPLHLACEQGQQLKIVELLLDWGADLELRDDTFKATPKGWAMFCGQDAVYALISKREKRRNSAL